MTSVLDIERAASRLRRHLQRARIPELRLLCGLRFFELLASLPDGGSESYFREFVPPLATAAKQCDPREFLPEEIEALDKLIDLIKNLDSGVVLTDDLAALEKLSNDTRSSQDRAVIAPQGRDMVVVTCLFVEYYPDIDLSPRGRLLSLRVTVSAISPKTEADDVVVRNPIEEPDDRFLAQARDSIKAARQCLLTKYGLSLKKRYRFDFAVDTTGARFTGDSLGVAFAVGAIVALAKTEVLRHRLSVFPESVFSGALLPDGQLAPVDSAALRLKIYRAFHSRIRCLVIPADHVSEAEKYARGLEEQSPGRRLFLIGADNLAAVLDNTELVQAERLTPAIYYSRRVARACRSVKVQIPILVALLAVLCAAVFYQFPKLSPWFDWNPQYVKLTKHGFEALNKDSVFLWDDSYPCDSITDRSKVAFGNLDNDSKNEIVFCPHPTSPSEVHATIYAYDDNGSLLFRRSGINSGPCVEDTSLHIPGVIDIVKRDTGIVIVTKLFHSYPAHTHIRTWSAKGDSLGWYWHRGFASTAVVRGFPETDNEYFLFRGTYNPLACASICALDLDSCYGVGPSNNSGPSAPNGNQEHYVLFPMSDIEIEEAEAYNGIFKIHNESNQAIRVVVGQFSPAPAVLYSLDYWLDHRLRVTHVAADDRFVAKRKRLVSEGRLPPMDWPSYCDMMRDSVLYWTDSGWVSEGQLRSAESLH